MISSKPGTLLYTTTVVDEPSIEFIWNSTAYMNSTLVTEMDIVHSVGTFQYIKLVHEVTEIALAIFQYMDQEFWDWFFTILLGTIAIFATIKTANYISMVTLGFASLFVLFGWYSLSQGVLALAILISLVSLLWRGDKLT